jgi:hypothetical protein
MTFGSGGRKKYESGEFRKFDGTREEINHKGWHVTQLGRDEKLM